MSIVVGQIPINRHPSLVESKLIQHFRGEIQVYPNSCWLILILMAQSQPRILSPIQEQTLAWPMAALPCQAACFLVLKDFKQTIHSG